MKPGIPKEPFREYRPFTVETRNLALRRVMTEAGKVANDPLERHGVRILAKCVALLALVIAES